MTPFNLVLDLCTYPQLQAGSAGSCLATFISHFLNLTQLPPLQPELYPLDLLLGRRLVLFMWSMHFSRMPPSPGLALLVYITWSSQVH